MTKTDTLAIAKTDLQQGVELAKKSLNVNGFDKAFMQAEAIQQLKQAMTPEVMKNIESLAGSPVGFKMDKPSYPTEVIKDAMITAIMYGVEVTGNQFNIIAGNCYVTKEGYFNLLSQIDGLKYEITPLIPRLDENKGSALVPMSFAWTYNGQENTKEINFAVKINKYMGADAAIGKATRKARKWLYEAVTGNTTADGDITEDQNAEVVESETVKSNVADDFTPPANGAINFENAE